MPVNAGDLTLARRGLEQALFDMEIAPTTDEPAPTASPGRPGNLVYRTVGAAPGQVKYVVANVPRSQLPALVRKLEEFRHKQDLKQDSLESAQTRLAMVDTPTEPNSKQEINQAAWLGRGALLREVLAESERAKKPAATQAVEGTAGESIASAEPTGHAKNVKSNAEYTQKARDFQGGLRAGPGPYDEAGAAPKGLAPGGGPNPSAAAPAEEQMKKSAAGKGTGVVAPVDSVAKEAPAPPVVAKSDRAPVIPSPLPGVAPATRKSEDDKAAQFAAGAGAADRALVAKDKSVADRADLRVDNKADAGLELAKRQERTAITETPQTVAQAPATQPALAGKYEREQATPPQAAEKAAPDAHGEGRARDARRSGEAHYNLCIILNAPAPAPDAKVEPSDSQPMDDKDADPGQE
ncbi:MAG: hypothetical protein NTV86_17965 [Planctomycetota bacterium]|nr:hypothetical protein [Planctomycetota bacterium]